MVRIPRLGTWLEQWSCDGFRALQILPCREIQGGVGLHPHLVELLELSARHLWAKFRHVGV